MKRMGKRPSFVIPPMALIAGIVLTQVSCNQSKTLDVRIKLGVVLKSGDVKNVARQDFIISKADIIDLWETSKKKSRWIPDLVKKDTEDELGYEAKINSFQVSINEKSTLINKLRGDFQGQRENIAQRLKEHLEHTYQVAAFYALGYYFVEYTNHTVGLDEQGFRAVEKTYTDLMNSDVKLGIEAKKSLAIRYVEFKDIKDSYAKYASALAAAGVSRAQHELDNLLSEQKELIESFNEKVAVKDKSYFEKAKTEFILNFKEAFVSVFKTDLNGEAVIRIPKGKYFIFCSSEIGLNHITWNYPTTIEKEGQYIELANDNAFSFKEEDTTQLLRVLNEALAKMEGIQPILK